MFDLEIERKECQKSAQREEESWRKPDGGLMHCCELELSKFLELSVTQPTVLKHCYLA